MLKFEVAADAAKEGCDNDDDNDDDDVVDYGFGIARGRRKQNTLDSDDELEKKWWQ